MVSILKLVAWVLRFVNNTRTKCDSRIKEELTLEEISLAERTLIKLVQGQFFPDTQNISGCNVFRDEEGILRVKTRIIERIDTPSFIYPIVLPDKCIFTQRLIEHYHQTNCHAGTQILLCLLREKYWIIKGRKAVRGIVKGCIKCRRFSARPPSSDPVPLPADRVKDAAVFEIVGIDLAGPLYVKHGDKVWMVLFTCAIYRAIHLELVSSLSTEAFLLSLRRFVARRGRPRIIYSDNGTNFRGAHNSLNDVDWRRVMEVAKIQRIVWKFNPPTASWWGGWWERLVRVVKELLKRTLGKAVLTYEELLTVLCDCESIVNSRPLTYLSEDSEDLFPITPAMFLIEASSSKMDDVDFVDSNHLRKRVRYRLKLLEQLRWRFRREYLSQLIEKRGQSQKSSSLKLGDIVLIGDDIKKRLDWPLAKVVRLLPGKDGKVRTVELKTQSGTFIRPIQRVFPLEVPSEGFQVLPLTSDKPEGETPDKIQNRKTVRIGPTGSINTKDKLQVSRSGRVIKGPEKLDLMNVTMF